MLKAIAEKVVARYAKNSQLAAIDPVTVMLIIEVVTMAIKAYIECKNKPQEARTRVLGNNVGDRVFINRAIKQAAAEKGERVSTIEALRLRRAFFESGKDISDEEVHKAFQEVDNSIV